MVVAKYIDNDLRLQDWVNDPEFIQYLLFNNIVERG